MELTALIDCPCCGNPLEGQWHDDSMDLEQMDGPPEAQQQCPACDEVFVAAYPGWTEFGGAG